MPRVPSFDRREAAPMPVHRCQNSRIRRPASSVGRVRVSGRTSVPGAGRRVWLGLLPGVEQALRVERLLDRGVEPVRLGAPLALELAAFQPADAVLAADRPAEADREVEQVVAGRVGAALLGWILGREQERGVDVAVARVAERERDDAVALADLERLARDVTQAVEWYGDVLAVGAP